MKYLPEDQFDEIHFFGDKYFKGGNDNEIYEHPRTIGHAITDADPMQTLKMLAELFPELPAPVRVTRSWFKTLFVSVNLSHLRCFRFALGFPDTNGWTR